MTLYGDSSALFKLYVMEPRTDDVQRMVRDASTIATSSIARVEILSALGRLRREKRLSPSSFMRARRRFEEDWPQFVAVAPDPGLLHLAADLALKHGLKSLDGIHLASFQQVLERTDDELEFLSFDDRLTRAAKRLR